MTTKTMQSFDSLTSIGLHKIPKNGIVQIENAVSNKSLYFTLLNTSNITPQINVLQFLVNFPADWAIIGSNINHSWDEATNILTVEM